MHANSLATIMLLSWPLFAALIFMRMERVNAAIWSILLAYMFLPPSYYIDLPVVPALGKYEIASVATAVMLWLRLGRKGGVRDPMADDTRPVMPVWTKFLVFLLLVSAVLTVLNNDDALVSGISYRPGMQLSDAVANAILQLIELIPFFIGFRLLSTPQQTRKLLVALMLAVLIYSIPMLLEVRLSPQLNTWIYGYFQHEFAQAMRYGGFRPIVFMYHPIWVASFATMGFIATLCLTRTYQVNVRMMLVICYLIVLLILCKTMTAILMAVLAMPLVLVASPRAVLTISAVVAIAVFVYPVLRLTDLVPTEDILGLIGSSQPERADSLQVRFDNEVILMARALERPMFGWGSWGRNFPVDPVSGRYGAIADGAWVITMGSRGILGYIAQFGLLISPIIILWQRRFALFRRFDHTDLLMITTLVLMMAINLIELIPNATLTPLTWLLNGAILGHAARLQYSRALRRRWQREDSEALAKKAGLRPAL